MTGKAYIQIAPYLQGALGRAVIERFWSKVDIRSKDECWDWKASLDTSGYGRFKLNPYVTGRAHRVALTIFGGDVGHGLDALHSCDRPKCCNPHHLRWGTVMDNVRDKIERGRVRSADMSGTKNPRAMLDEDELRFIIDCFRKGWTNKRIAEFVPVGHSLISRIRVGIAWAKETQALGWEPKPQFERRRAA